MKFRNVVIIGLMFVALAGYIVLFERHQQSTEALSHTDLAVFHVIGSQVSGLTLEFSPALRIEFIKKNARWYFSGTGNIEADSETVESLLSELEMLRAQRIIAPVPGNNNKVDMEQYGLLHAAKKIRVKTSSAEQVLCVGKKTAMGKTLFAALENDIRVFVLPDAVENIFNKKAEDFRMKSN